MSVKPVDESIEMSEGVAVSPPGSRRTTSTNITGDQGTGVEKWPRDGVRRDDADAPKRVKARVISSSLRS